MKINWNEIFEYRDGNLFWKIKIFRSKRNIGDIAGGLRNNNYRQVQYGNKQYMEHRIIWEVYYGPIPEDLEIDHINRIRDDNRLENLRLVSKEQQQINRIVKDKTGKRGVYFNKISGKYYSQIKVKKVRFNLGYFNTIEEAANAYNVAAIKYHGVYAIVNKEKE